MVWIEVEGREGGRAYGIRAHLDVVEGPFIHFYVFVVGS